MFASCNLFVGVRVIDVWGRGNIFFCEIVGVVVDKIVYKIVVCWGCGTCYVINAVKKGRKRFATIQILETGESLEKVTN